MTRLSIYLDDHVAEALARLAYAEMRDTRAQAAVIIRDELVRRGLIAGADTAPNSAPARAPQTHVARS